MLSTLLLVIDERAVIARGLARSSAFLARWLFAIALLLPLAACARDWRSHVASPAVNASTLEEQTYARINEYRVSRGLRRLAWSEVIADQARRHSQKMARGSTGLGHSAFKSRVAAIGKSHSWKTAAENVAVNRTAASVVERWVKRRSHRKNIEGDFDLTGVGAAVSRDGAVYFTQIFIKSK